MSCETFSSRALTSPAYSRIGRAEFAPRRVVWPVGLYRAVLSCRAKAAEEVDKDERVDRHEDEHHYEGVHDAGDRS